MFPVPHRPVCSCAHLAMSSEQVLARALGYPYPRPSHSFLFPCGPSPAPLSPSSEAAILSDPSLTFMLAIGSNAAPSRLLAKFGPSSSRIPVLAVRVSGVDVVHSACIANYGSVSATVMPCAGVVLSTHVTLLDAHQLAAMHATEGGYAVVRVRTELVRMQSGVTLRDDREVLAYVWQGGPMRAPDGKPRALEMFEAEGRTLESCSQREAIEVVRDVAVRKGIVGKEESVETFVLRNVEDENRRRAVLQAERDEWKNNAALDSDGIWEVVQLL